MKNYDELTNDLLERRDRYVADQKRKRKTVISVAASFCCVGAVALVGFGVWQSGMLQNEPPILLDHPAVGNHSDIDKVEQPTANSNGQTSQNPNNIEQTDHTAADNEIRILEIDSLPEISDKMFIALISDDYIQMNDDEMNEYYGVNVFPAVPTDLDRKDGALGIYKQKTSGELYYDGNKIQYSNEDFSRTIAVNVDKDILPYSFYDLFTNVQTRSILNDVEVGIAKTPIGEMYAEFMYQNVGFRIYAFGLTQDEFVAIITSIIQ